MVARAKARSWNKLKLVAGLVVGAVVPPWAAAEVPLEVGPPATLVAQLQGRSTAGAHGALTAAIESQRRGDYDTADVLLRNAQAGQEELSPTERQELARAVQTNAAVMKARREAGETMRQADKALLEGNARQAAELLKAIAANEQYLAPAERQLWQQLSERAKQKAAGAAAPAPANPADKTKAALQQARAQLALANFDAAEALAKSCERPGATYAKGEDTPRKVLDDCRKQRGDAKFILSAARAALERNELDRAEELAKAADKASGLFTFPVWADSPNQCFKDVQAARAKKSAADKNATAAAGRTAPASGEAKQKPADLPAPTKAPDPKVAAANTAKARALLAQARKALQGGDVAQAKKLNEEARALKPELSWWEENPEKLHADVMRAEAHAKAQAPAGKNAKPAPGESKEAAVALVKQGRVQLAEGKLDEATQSVLKAKAMTSVHWGLFDVDSPDKLNQDVEKARGKRDRDESEKVLAEARHLYEKKEYENAERAAYRAQKLHGPYSVWDFGDRPNKLLAEIETARSKERKIKVPAPTEVVKQDDKTPPAVSAKEGPAVGTPTPNPADVARARLMLSDARVALKNGDAAGAKALAEQVKRMPVSFDRPGEDTADAVLRDADALVMARGNPAPRNQGLVPTSYQQTANPAAAPSGDAAKVQARAMLGEARKLQGQGRLLEARQRAVEAQNLHTVFTPDEDSPERLLLQLGALARQQIDGLMVQANDLANSAKGDPAAWQRKAEENLAHARQLALAFGQDVQPVDAKLHWLHGLRGGAAPAPAVVTGQPGATAQGRKLLDDARMELRSGQTATARKLANEACSEAYGVRDEALAVLRTIDNEEFNQRRIAVNRTFDAAAAAFNRREYGNSYGIITSIDVRLLDEVRQARLREIMQTPEMAAARNQGQPAPEVKATGTVLAGGPGTALPPLGKGDPRLAPPGKASASDANPEQDTLKRMEALRNVKFQALRQESLDLQKSAAEKFRTGQTDAAIEMLQEFVARLDKEQLDPGQISMLKRPVDSRLTRFKLLKAQEDIKNGTDATARAGFQAHSSKILAEQKKQRNVADLMKQYNALLQDGKYLEAESIAMKAHELDPDNYVVSAAITMAKYQSRIALNKLDKDQKEAYFWNVMRDTEKGAPALTNDHPVDVTTVDKDKFSRRKNSSLVTTKLSEKEREIENRLYAPVNLNFKDTPLQTVLDDLRSWQGINIYVDQEALDAEAISIDRPVTIKMEQVALRSALPLLLKQAHLTYVIKDDVLQITTESQAKGRRETRTYTVADLVNQVPNFGSLTPGYVPRTVNGLNANLPNSVPSPVLSQGSLSTGAPVGNPTGSALSSFPNPGSSGTPTQTVTKSNPTGTMEESLIRLITSSVQPRSWADMGGTGTIEYFAPTMALVINQTPDIQEEIASLLAALRRLQDQEVAIEIRLITISENFFERIGVNFNVNFTTNDNARFGRELEAGTFQPNGLIQVFQPKNFLTGLTPAGTFTPDLNIPIANQSFGAALPPFGGYSGIPGAGGLSLGLAFLSDIQVFLFLEAVQGDQRTNVMQAPKLSLFNGQTATIMVAEQQNFVTSTFIGFQNGVPIFSPTTQTITTGIPNLAMNAIISADRRFVRMSLAIDLTNMSNDIVPLFPVVVPIFQGLDGFQAGQPVVFTQFIQQPRTTDLMVNTTVAVPDGGTVLMGGLKRLSEGRTEFGPPVLSKIPYVNRLFKNVGYGREAESLLIMVTPRIIIMEEEEARVLGQIGPGIEITR